MMTYYSLIPHKDNKEPNIDKEFFYEWRLT